MFRLSFSQAQTLAAQILAALLGCSSAVCMADFSDLTDPTKPAQFEPKQINEKQAAPSVHRLASIIISPTRKVAVINGQVLTEGEQVDGASVLRITDGQVSLQLADKSQRTLSLHDSRPGQVTKSFRQRVAATTINPAVNDTERLEQSEVE